ncbi:WD domain-containing protein [Colletotrichum kahawae]|uniref:WD domain-containing protein n=1 Tax=Colletotrichum kahawae TaxID=34407 RepID=A0AAE0D3M5_COLKA|nr:WD domain-containing protein [Colletotrichum kahawae]
MEDWPKADNKALWDLAYVLVKKEDGDLVARYEDLLLEERGREMSISNHSNGQTDNWNNMTPKERQETLETMIQKGMLQMAEKKTKYTIFGHEFSPRQQLKTAADFIQRTKVLVDKAVNVSREAALAWAGVCIILPILTNPFEAEKDNQEGFIYITSRIPIYVELQNELRQRPTTGFTRAIEDQIVVIYQHIIDYQLRTVLRLYMTKIKRAAVDTFKSIEWKGLVSRTKELEQILDGDLRKLNDNSIIKIMEDLKANADKTVDEITATYPAPPAHSSQNHSGPGHNMYAEGNINNMNAKGDIMYSASNGAILNHPRFDKEVRFG